MSESGGVYLLEPEVAAFLGRGILGRLVEGSACSGTPISRSAEVVVAGWVGIGSLRSLFGGLHVLLPGCCQSKALRVSSWYEEKR